MKDKISSIIMFFVILLIIGVFGIFGLIIWQELQNMKIMPQIETLNTIFSSKEETQVEEIKTPEIVENPLDEIKRVESNENINYENVNIDKYFYNQLESYAKTIYKALEANHENMKTGNYEIKLGDSFSSILDKSNGQEELGKYYQSAIEAYTYDNPEIFYLSANKMYLNIETTTKGNNTTYNVYINNGKEQNYLADEFNSKEQIDIALNRVEEVKNQILQNRKGNIYQDIKMVHDYLVNNVQYDTTISKQNIYNVYGTLVNGEAVCEGYARTFKYLMDEMGIPCTMVIGKATNSENRTENHAWNYVQIDGSWYAVDVTWDDPVITGGGWLTNSLKYKYFLKGSGDFLSDHTPNNQFTNGGKIFEYPKLSVLNY